MSIQPLLQVEAALIRRQLPDLLIRPGQTFAARVAERNGRHAIITLAGSPIVAELPDGVNTGDKLKLLVQESRGEKVLMKLVPEEPAAPPQAAPVATLPLPGGGQARIEVDPDSESQSGSADPDHASISLTYASPELGPVGLKIALAPGAVTVRAELMPGRPLDLAEDSAMQLESRLAAATGRSAGVTVIPRHLPVDLYA